MVYLLIALEQEFKESVFTHKKLKIKYTGVGKINATMGALNAANQNDCDYILNYGTAGTFNKNLIGKLLTVDNVMQRDMDARPISPLGITPFENHIFSGALKLTGKEKISLSSGDNFVMKNPELKSDLVDMEGYAIAKVATKFCKKIIIKKYVTDLANDDASEDWIKNCQNGQEIFKNWLQLFLHNYP